MISSLGQIVGGVGLFLIGTELLRRGFEESAGHSLRRILSDFTDQTFKGLVAGFIVSSAVQSATAVIFTLIGFVNAKLLHLRHAVPAVFGANLGKITIVLLITAIGFRFNIASYALPVLGAGTFLRVFLKRRNAGLATALMGFGLIFLGIDTLKNSIELVNQEMDLSHLAIAGQRGVLVYLFAGMLVTFVTQSSTSAIVITLSGLAGGILSLENAVALVIGENFGTTSSALLASHGASPAAKRLSVAHMIYNLACTVIGLAMLEFLMLTAHMDWLVSAVSGDATIGFTVFYAAYIFLPLTFLVPAKQRLVAWLETRFHDTKSLGAPKFIDREKVHHPDAAVQSLHSEVLRFGKIAGEMLDAALKWQMKNGWIYTVDLSLEEKELDNLSEHIHWFAASTARRQTSSEVVKTVQLLSMASRHFETVSDLSKKISKCKGKFSEPIRPCPSFERLCEWTEGLRTVLAKLDAQIRAGDLSEIRAIDAEFRLFEDKKNALRQELLDAGVSREMSSAQIIILIDLIDSCRRAMRDQFRGLYETWEMKDAMKLPADNDLPEISGLRIP